MKGGIAAGVHAGLTLARERRGDADIVLVIVAGEETGCDGRNINSVPDSARFSIDIRAIPGHDHDEILAGLKGLLGDGIDLAPKVDVMPILTTPPMPRRSRPDAETLRR